MKLRYLFTGALIVSMLCACASTETDNAGSAPELQESIADSVTETTVLSTEELPVIHEEKFHGAYAEITIDDFIALGFDFGDSCDISFSNGFSLTDVPFYNGYYAKFGEPIISGYPEYPYIDICFNDVSSFWQQAGLSEGDTVVITLHEKGKFISTQEAFSLTFSNEREEFESDAIFANYREMSGGRLKSGILYRGASPCDNEYMRAPYVDALLKDSGVNFVLDLADSDENISGYCEQDDFTSEYFKSLYDNGQVAALNMATNYRSDEYVQALVTGLQEMIQYEGPYYVHCTLGIDRTGFVCMLLEALSGATYDEMLTDYMITYDNYYGITKESSPDQYDAIVDLKFNSYVAYLHGTDDLDVLKEADFTEDAVNYLKNGGMSEEQIDTLVSLLTTEE